MENHIGNMIRQRVAEMPGMTSKLLAEKLGVHEQTIYDIYKRPSINTDILLKICRILEVPFTYFLGTPEVYSESSESETNLKTSSKAEDLQPTENKSKSKAQVNYSFTNKRQELPFNYTGTSLLESSNNTLEDSSSQPQQSASGTKNSNLGSTSNTGNIPPHVQFPQPPATASPLANISQSIREIRDMQYKQELEHALEKIHLLEKQLADKELIIQLLLEKIKLTFPNSEY